MNPALVQLDQARASVRWAVKTIFDLLPDDAARAKAEGEWYLQMLAALAYMERQLDDLRGQQ
jgi:hypothetical protein